MGGEVCNSEYHNIFISTIIKDYLNEHVLCMYVFYYKIYQVFKKYYFTNKLKQK